MEYGTSKEISALQSSQTPSKNKNKAEAVWSYLVSLCGNRVSTFQKANVV